MTKRKSSAGLLMFKGCYGQVQVFLVPPGGPFWKKKDEGAWSIPKGEYGEGEHAFDAVKGEFEDEKGIKPHGEFIALDQITQPSGKGLLRGDSKVMLAPGDTK